MSQRIFVTRRIPPEGIDLLKAHHEVRIWPGDDPIPPADLLDNLANCDAVLSMLTDRINDAVLDHAPHVRVVSNYAVGYDNIDIPACTRRGIPVGHTPDVLTESSADLAFALILASARRLPEAQAYVRAGQWQSWDPLLLLGRDVYGATLGIVGFGRIGQAIARRARGFSMRLLVQGGSDDEAVRRLGAQRASLDDLLSQSDYVSINVPLTAQTRHLIGARELGLMKQTAILINTARGPVVDTAALVTALRDQRIRGAALDVTDPEPLPADHPLTSMENCLVVPHIASASIETRSAMGVRAAQNILAALAGEHLPFCVNPEVYG